jgi:hypothetical protein
VDGIDPVTASVGDVDPDVDPDLDPDVELAVDPDVDLVDALLEEPEPTPDLSEQPPTDLEDLPVVPELGSDPEGDPDGDPDPADLATAGTSTGPKRRRRATSRPAGPPTVSV